MACSWRWKLSKRYSCTVTSSNTLCWETWWAMFLLPFRQFSPSTARHTLPNKYCPNDIPSSCYWIWVFRPASRYISQHSFRIFTFCTSKKLYPYHQRVGSEQPTARLLSHNSPPARISYFGQKFFWPVTDIAILEWWYAPCHQPETSSRETWPVRDIDVSHDVFVIGRNI